MAGLSAGLLFLSPGAGAQTEPLFDDDPLAAEQRQAEREARQAAAFQERLVSARSLLDAYQRLVEEQSLDGAAADGRAAIREALARAEARFAAGEREAARVQLEDAYVRVEVSLGALLDGTTLRLPLNFASAEEEYRYEQRRHATHRELVARFLAEPEARDASRQRLLAAVEVSETLRDQAAAQAGRGEYETAIATLENATRELIRALRSVGIFIPG
ncbi:hypothetical protein [Halomonas alkalisoli]|uniref:hypothetical protein n=1 Tax=Halomonas alkalisoli TaxID=2907158 RepID=UPI001F43EF94|nr:hypothetical protein [Halomonas alkalisoli]